MPKINALDARHDINMPTTANDDAGRLKSATRGTWIVPPSTFVTSSTKDRGLINVQPATINTLKVLQAKWSAAAQAAGAAPLTIVNDLNGEETPVLNAKTFRYLETDYI